MAETKSTTKDVSGMADALCGTKTFETTISNGRESVTARDITPQGSQEKASEKWNND